MNNYVDDFISGYNRRLEVFKKLGAKFLNVPNGFKFLGSNTIYCTDFKWYKVFKNIFNDDVYNCRAELLYKNSEYDDTNAYLCLVLDVFPCRKANIKPTGIANIKIELLLKKTDYCIMTYKEVDFKLISKWCRTIDYKYVSNILTKLKIKDLFINII